MGFKITGPGRYLTRREGEVVVYPNGGKNRNAYPWAYYNGVGEITVTNTGHQLFETVNLSADIVAKVQEVSEPRSVNSALGDAVERLYEIAYSMSNGGGSYWADEIAAVARDIDPDMQAKKDERKTQGGSLDFDDYSARAYEFARYPKTPIVWLYPALALAEEAGEVSGKLAKIVRDKGGVISIEDKLAITKELGDVLWQVNALCKELDIDLHNVALTNLNKLEARAAKGTIHGSGDNR